VSSAATVIEFPRRQPRPDPAFESEARRGAAEERQRITREVHDVVSYSLATISMQAAVALHVLEQQPDRAVEALSAIKAASKDALNELREILGLLRQADLQSHPGAPGLGRLDALVDSLTAAGVRTELRFVGRRRPLPAAVDLTAFRIVQEALTNVLRHAGPATAVVTIAFEREALVVEVEDDGREHAIESSTMGSGSGIVGMRQRAAAVGGEVEASPRQDGGFRVRARLPVLGRS
jgi:signal transduction histidine kinase